MALLKPQRRPPGRFARGASLFAMLALGSCVLMQRFSPGETTFAFSHAIHVGGEGLDCFNCHENALVADEPGMPAPETCEQCHTEIDEEKPPERQVALLFDGDSYRAARSGALASELFFSHKLHATGQDCAACHAELAASERSAPELALTMDDCTSCHAQKAAPNTCEDCHRVIREDWAPESHEHNWMRFHGGVVRAESEATSDDCALCHGEATCVQCHLEEPPESHDEQFRGRGHGFFASMDRGSCAVCHRSDSCERCHAEVLPQSHVGAWSSPRSTHCLSCHFPLKSEGCVACHKSTPGHMSTPKPPGHNPAMNCRQCHNTPIMLPHVDKGDDCNGCHP